MNKRSLRGLLPAALCGLAVLWGGLAQAYLSPLNPDAVTAGVIPQAINDPNYVIGPGSVPDYLTTPNWAYTPPIRKFKDTLPGLTVAGKNNLNQYIPVATPDIVTYPGSDYYVIELRQYTEQMHTDLPPTTLRGYIQVNSGTDQSGGCVDPGVNPAAPNVCTQANNTVAPPAEPHYLGPLIVAQKDRPVRVKFVNMLPTGAGGELFIPVDTTVMGSGPFEIDYDPVTKQPTATKTGMFAQNRATLHLHGGRTPWISDGTPHQWITPAGEVTDYPTGVSVENVPDMPDPGPGAQTFYWTNQQSSRMMFYHDHAWGITRLNVYVGEAAGYLIRDPVENDLVNGTNVTGVNPGLARLLPADEIPLVIEDKTFVDANTVRLTDPTWNWGTGALDPNTGIRAPKTGDLWWPHVYMPAQNPFDITGIAPMGRWAYGPWFYPATPNPYQPVPNPYYSDLCDPAGDPATTPGLLGGPYGQFCQPLEIPGTPTPSWGAEAFMDTQTVNGTAYPTVTLEPKPYRFRILNASHDRFLSLALYKADTAVDPNVAIPGDPLTTASAALCATFPGGCATETEMKMVPATPQVGAPATWPVDGRAGGVPDYTTAGPSWIMFGTEGGFLPKPVVIPPHPLTWNINPSMFNVGNINGGSLILGPAERADVVVDFSQIPAGTTLILYNDGAAPWPALNPTYDYYTGDPDQRDVGGADTTLPGFGPNTRTIMQIKIAGAAGAAFNLPALQEAFTSYKNHGGHPSVFETAQDPIIAAQGDMNRGADPTFYEAFLFPETFDAYTKAYDPLTPFPTQYPNWGISRINDQTINFVGVDGSTTYKYDRTKPLNNALPMKRKAIHDEMGATWDDYGRMRAALGLELSNQGPLQVNFIVQTYSDPSTEILEQNGIQVWKITHNGVDTHPIHFHLYDVQILNRVGWDGFIRLPDPNELGWKDTVRISPLEDTIVALKPAAPKVPFGVPESYRPLNPATLIGSTTELSTVDPTTGQAWATPNVNRFENFDWEYVWHCHILSHEENDMMRSQIFLFQEVLPSLFSITSSVLTPGQVALTWADLTPATDPATLGNPQNEIGFYVQRSTGGGAFTNVATTLANVTSYTDTTIAASTAYNYRVAAFNAKGLTYSSIATVTPPSITTASPMPSGQRTVAYNQTLAATGGTAPYTWAITVGSLPAGLSLDGATGAITGTPTTLGTSNFTARVTDANGVTATKALSISIVVPITITTNTLPAGTVGAGYQQYVAASGGATPYTWSVSAGALPNGLAIRASDGRISGTPTTVGTFNFTVRVLDSVGATATKALSIVVNAAPLTITTNSLPAGTAGTAYQQYVVATGGVPPRTFSISAGALPTGLSIRSTDGRISGTPTAAGTFNFTVRVQDSLGAFATKALSIVVNLAPLTITTNSLPAGTLGTGYQQYVVATGGLAPRTFSISAGALPPGLALRATDGRISGTPTARGTFTFTVRVTDSQATPATATKQLSITVN